MTLFKVVIVNNCAFVDETMVMCFSSGVSDFSSLNPCKAWKKAEDSDFKDFGIVACALLEGCFIGLVTDFGQKRSEFLGSDPP